jgi:hypothetical protein
MSSIDRTLESRVTFPIESSIYFRVLTLFVLPLQAKASDELTNHPTGPVRCLEGSKFLEIYYELEQGLIHGT